MRQSPRWPFRSVLSVPFVLLPLLTFAGAAAQASVASKPLHPAASAVELRDGVLVDGARTTLYLMSPGGVDAVDLLSGEVLWTSTAAAKPLALVGDRLVAQAEPAAAGELPIVTLDRRTGALAGATKVELPAAVWATLDARPSYQFRARAAAVDGGVELAWLATWLTKSGTLQGYLPSPEEGRAPDDPNVGLDAKAQPADRLAGSVRLDLGTGEVTALAGEKALAFVAGTTLREQAVLDGVAGRQFLAADGRHVLVSERGAPTAFPVSYRWSLRTLAGEPVGEVESTFAAAPFVVAGDVLLVESFPRGVKGEGGLVERPLEIRAIDLGSGAELWTKAVRPTELGDLFAP